MKFYTLCLLILTMLFVSTPSYADEKDDYILNKYKETFLNSNKKIHQKNIKIEIYLSEYKEFKKTIEIIINNFSKMVNKNFIFNNEDSSKLDIVFFLSNDVKKTYVDVFKNNKLDNGTDWLEKIKNEMNEFCSSMRFGRDGNKKLFVFINGSAGINLVSRCFHITLAQYFGIRKTDSNLPSIFDSYGNQSSLNFYERTILENLYKE